MFIHDFFVHVSFVYARDYVIFEIFLTLRCLEGFFGEFGHFLLFVKNEAFFQYAVALVF